MSILGMDRLPTYLCWWQKFINWNLIILIILLVSDKFTDDALLGFPSSMSWCDFACGWGIIMF